MSIQVTGKQIARESINLEALHYSKDLVEKTPNSCFDSHKRELLCVLNDLGMVMQEIGVNYRLGGILNIPLCKMQNCNDISEMDLYRMHTDLDVIIDSKYAQQMFQRSQECGYEVCTYKIFGKNQFKFIPLTYEQYRANETSMTVLVPRDKISSNHDTYDIYDIFFNKSDDMGNEVIYKDVTIDNDIINDNKLFVTSDGHKIPLSNEVDVILRKLQNCRIKDIQDIHRIIEKDYRINPQSIHLALDLINKAVVRMFEDIYHDLKESMQLDDLVSKYEKHDNKLFHGRVYGTTITRYIIERTLRVFDIKVGKEEFVTKAYELFYETQVGIMIKSISTKLSNNKS